MRIIGLKTLGHLRRSGGLEEEFNSLLKVRPPLLDRVALGGDVEFGAEGDVAVLLAPDRRRKKSGHAFLIFW